MSQDARRRVPRTDAVLADPRVVAAVERHGREGVRAAVRATLARVRAGEVEPEGVVEEVLATLPRRTSSLTPVLNATGVVIHTNLGRAPLSRNAIEAVVDAAGYVDVELDLATGARGPRGQEAIAALLDRVPDAEAAHVVGNGAAALALATTALAAGKEIVVSRGEMVEIGDGFRLPDLIESTGARLREVGTTNRTHLADYTDAVGPGTGCILKVHPSNFLVSGFTSSVDVTALSGLGVPVVMDIGSGLLAPDPALPDEPDAASALRAGAHVVTASGDKLLGGPQAGLILGRADLVQRLRRHPLARALRVDKLTLAALEATLRGPEPPTTTALHALAEDLLPRTRALADALGREVVPVEGRVGGGGGPGVPLPGWAVEIPAAAVERLRRPSDPTLATVLARIEDGRGLVDLRCVPAVDDERLLTSLRHALNV